MHTPPATLAQPAGAYRPCSYEALGLEFARLLAGLRPDLAEILADEETHVAFFEREVRTLLEAGGRPATGAREFAKAWWRRLPPTVDRYLTGDGLETHAPVLREAILGEIRRRFTSLGLLPAGA